jgi:hypothetical protein
MIRLILCVLTILILMPGCAKQPTTPWTPPRAKHSPVQSREKSVQTMITGLDQYPKDDVMVLTTVDDSYIIGPDVSLQQITAIHTHLTEAHDRVVTIWYIHKEATNSTIAHKRVTRLAIEDKTYLLPH